MDLLIKQVVILDRQTPNHRKLADLLIRNGVIERIDRDISASGISVLDARGAFVSPGWFDVGVQTGDPGYEHREDLKSAARAAAAGGFTGIACLPNTLPVLQTKSEILYVRNNTQGWLVECHPIGAISRDAAGKEITEMIDMHASGALAFSDGKNPVQDSGLLLRALQYVTAFGGIILNQPHDSAIAGEGQMHEGRMSTSLGLKGIPPLAEELMVQRDLELLAYSGSRLHLSNLSTAGSVERVRQAKARGLRVSCSVAALNLAIVDEALFDFDTALKVLPPLREEDDRKALLEGLRDGTIDFISSNHVPLEEEAKKLEFPFARFGAIGLETAFSTALSALEGILPVEDLVERMSIKPRQIFGLPLPRIAEGEMANLTVFDPAQKHLVQAERQLSKSRNSPFLGQELNGRVLAVINHNQSAIFDRP